MLIFFVIYDSYISMFGCLVYSLQPLLICWGGADTLARLLVMYYRILSSVFKMSGSGVVLHCVDSRSLPSLPFLKSLHFSR